MSRVPSWGWLIQAAVGSSGESEAGGRTARVGGGGGVQHPGRLGPDLLGPSVVDIGRVGNPMPE